MCRKGKYFVLAILWYLLFYPLVSFPLELMLSNGSPINIGQPERVYHPDCAVYYIYPDGKLVHVVLDATRMYPDQDLSGHLRQFVLAIFNRDKVKLLSGEIGKLADAQAAVMGLKAASRNGQLCRAITGVKDGEVCSAYSAEPKQGDIYILLGEKVELIRLYGSNDKFKSLVADIVKGKEK